MSRDDGFAVMDVAVDVTNDPKVRKLFRHVPDHAAVAFMAYIATMGESWRHGRRVNVDEAWPSALPFDRVAVDALMHVGLIDKRGTIPPKTWRHWFEVARERRSRSRDRWARYNAKRDADTTPPPRGNDVGTATSVPSFRPSVPTVPSVRPSARARGEKNGTSPEDERRRVLEQLSEDYKAGRLSEVDYERERRVLTA
jgi:hypothetical protein